VHKGASGSGEGGKGGKWIDRKKVERGEIGTEKRKVEWKETAKAEKMQQKRLKIGARVIREIPLDNVTRQVAVDWRLRF
jgi:hypothetical protein